jgi:arginyl-tRNA synthetase
LISPLNKEITIFLNSIEGCSKKSIDIINEKYSSTISDDLGNGHITSNVCMVAASVLKLNPKELSVQLATQLNSLNIYEKVEAAGPGFVNITLKRNDFLSILETIKEEKEFFGQTDTKSGERVQIEFVSANPTGPLHVGHGRGAAYGDAIARILTAAGSIVEKEYYINDAGRQIDILTASVMFKLNKSNNDFFPQNAYKGIYINDIATNIKNEEKLEIKIDDSIFLNLPKDPEEEIDKLIAILKNSYKNEWLIIKECSLSSILESIKSDLKDFNVEFDVWYKESSLGSLDNKKSKISTSIKKLQDDGEAYIKNGAVWLNTEKSGDDKHRVLVRDDGRATYFASDVAYHKDKVDRKFNKLINVWGADHHGYIKRIEASIEALGDKKEKLIVKLVQFANLFKDGKKVKMSTRSGDFYSLRDLINDIGPDAARFYYLSKQADQHLDFDIDLARSDSKENIFYYIQYAHARIFSLEEKFHQKTRSKEISRANAFNASYLKCDKLIHEISKYPSIVNKSAATLHPHLIIFYLRDLSQLLHSFYNDNHVLSEDPENLELIISSLSSVRQVISNGLSLIGISPIQEM